MNPTAEITRELSALLAGHYDSMDRMSLTGYFRLGSTSGGLLKWWNALTGGQPLSEEKLRAFAGTFSRRVRAWAAKNNIPLIDFALGDRTKHEQAEKLQPTDPAFRGVFAVFVSRAPALTWQAYTNPKGKVVLYRPKRGSLVNHYYFHIIDPEWGHVTIRLCGHPPFAALVMLNAHEWVERTATREGVKFVKHSNCFVEGSDLPRLDRIAGRLLAPGAIIGLAEVCERWIYSACLCFGLTREEQCRSGFAYQFSVYQIEYSRNLVFHSGRRLDEYYQALVQRIWPALDVPRMKTIFGRSKRPHRQGASPIDRRVERTQHDLTVLKLKFARLELKMYDKGARVLRVEMIARHIDDLRCGRQLARVPLMLQKARQILLEFLNVVQAVHQPTLDARHLDALAAPSRRGDQRIAGVDLQKPRMKVVTAAVIALAASPHGFTVEELTSAAKRQRPPLRRKYRVRQAGYDLRKLRAKGLVQRIGRTRRYQVRKSALRVLAGWFVLREKVIKPVLEGACRPRPGRLPQPATPLSTLEQHYWTLQRHMHETLAHLKLAA